MKNINTLMILMLCLTIGLVGCTNKEKVEDVEVVEPVTQVEDVVEDIEEVVVKNIIAGTLMSAELLDLFDINPIGVLTTEKALPERYKDIPKIGSPMKPDLEIVTSLNPDLYVSDSNLKEGIEEIFKSANLETMFLSSNSYEDVFKNIETLGAYLNNEDKANAIVSEMRNKEKEIMDSITGKESSKVLILFGTLESFMIATQHSYTGNLVEILGGINVAGDLAKDKPMPYVPFSLETVADLNPGVILRLTHASPEISKKAFDEEFKKGFWVNLDAVKNEKVFDLDPEYFGVSANMRVMDALEQMAKILYN